MNTLNILHDAAHLAFVERVLQTLDDIEYRRIRTAEDLDGVIALRTKTYRAHKVYVRDDAPMTDALDLDPRYFGYAVYWRGILIASVRLHIVTADNPHSTSRSYYPYVLDPLLAQGLTFMDPTRFSIDPDLANVTTGLPLVTLRLGFLAAKHFNTDFCLSMIKKSHTPFYRKVFRSTQLTPYLPFQTVHAHYALFSSPRTMEDPICAEYPLFRSTATERAMLFEERAAGAPRTLNVRPTARLAIRQRAAQIGETLRDVS
jgi:hypothetical protein